MEKILYTIGHSTHPLVKFVELLNLHEIKAVCDVRSSPYSRYNPQFNRETIQAELKKHGIAYVYLGKELGPRSDDPGCYENGKVQYDRLAKTDLFQRGIKRVTRLMARLNRKPAEIMSRYEVHACTDITGFGLLGHLAEMVTGSGQSIRLLGDAIPMIPEAREYGQMGFVPAGAYRNREFREGMVEFGRSVDRLTQDILFDPQTSGGLLISVSRDVSEALVRELNSDGVPEAVIIGEVMSTPEEKIFVQ